MKIKDANAGVLSNFEVLKLLRSRGATQDPLGSIGSAAPSECKVFDYLVQSAACEQNEESVREFLETVKQFEITKAEKLQVLNLRPTTAVEVHMIIEDCEERMSEDSVQEFISTVKRILPSPPPKTEDENAVEEEKEEEDGGNAETGDENEKELDEDGMEE